MRLARTFAEQLQKKMLVVLRRSNLSSVATRSIWLSLMFEFVDVLTAQVVIFFTPNLVDNQYRGGLKIAIFREFTSNLIRPKSRLGHYRVVIKNF